jgi:lycopene cyclase domain-containing protein
MKWEYFIVLGATLFFPFLLSFDKRLPIWKNIAKLAITAFCVSVPFITWDVVVTMRGHWSFNPNYVLGVEVLGLPIEEWAFFVVIVFVSVFTWEALKIVAERKR